MKYSFDKSSKKFICPSCNKKRFVRFIDLETIDYLEAKYGKCDRESSCGYYNKPRNNSQITTQKNFIEQKKVKKNNKTIPYIDSINANQPQLKKNLQHTLQKYCVNNFYNYLINLFDTEEVQKTFNNYKIGKVQLFFGKWMITIQ